MTEQEIDNLISLVKGYNNIELAIYVEKLLKERKDLIENAEKDRVTGLYTRNIISRIKGCSAVVMCDIDNFKMVNDTLGHNKGDDALKKVARILQHSVRSIDYVIRWGGDELLIAFSECPENAVCERMENIRKQVEQNGEYPVTLSIGIAINNDREDFQTLTEEADNAMYYSKKNGKNRIAIYSPELPKKPQIEKPKVMTKS